MNAPVCPISFGETPYERYLRKNGAILSGAAPNLPSIPNATDLPTLIRTTNVIRDVLRALTTSLTVNNISIPRQPFAKAQGDTFYSQYPEWDQKTVDTVRGFMYHHPPEGGIDKNHRAYVQRINSVTYQNRMQEDPDFIWTYVKPLDEYGSEPFLPTASFTGE